MRVLIVCAGNTCRSPTLQLLLQHIAGRLGRDDEFVSAGRNPGARGGYSMPVPGQNALKAAITYVNEKLPVSCEQARDPLKTIDDEALGHKSRSLDDVRLRGPFDELILISGKGVGPAVRELLKSRRDLDRLSVPPRERWKVVRQRDSGYSALERAHARLKNDREAACDPEVVDAYTKQAKRLANKALKYYAVPL